MLAARGLVHAEVVDVEGLDGLHVVGVREVLHDAEGVTVDFAGRCVVGHGDPDGAVVVGDDLGKLGVGVFAGVGAEEVGAALVVHHQHLVEELDEARRVGSGCAADVHVFLLTNDDSLGYNTRYRATAGPRLGRNLTLAWWPCGPTTARIVCPSYRMGATGFDRVVLRWAAGRGLLAT